MGKALAPRVAARLGRPLLELGGNNAMIVAPERRPRPRGARDRLRAVGTAGQRCTTLRRLIVHESVADELLDAARARLRERAGRRSARGRHARRPAHRRATSFDAMQARARARARRRRRGVSGGERALADEHPDAFYVAPRARAHAGARPAIVREETFAPILYVMHLRRARRGDRAAERRAAGPLVVHLHERPARGRAVPRRRAAATAASRTSTSARAAPRSAARSAARRRPAAAASRAPTRGRRTCAARPRRSTARASSRWRRASSSTWAERRRAQSRSVRAHPRSSAGPQ